MQDNHTLAFITPYHQATKGHRNIMAIVEACALEAQAELEPKMTFVPIFQPGFMREHMLGGLTPRLILVDFPDSGHRVELSLAQEIDRLRDSCFISLDMYRPDPDPDQNPRPNYFLSIGLEPDAVVPSRTSVNIDPLLNPRHLAPLTEDDLKYWSHHGYDADTVLVLQSGTLEERRMMGSHALQTYKNRKVVLSSTLPQPAMRFARCTDRILSAGGYSTVWELAALGVIDKVDWILLPRYSEDCARRIRTAMTANGAQQLIERRGNTALTRIILDIMRR